jgi:hypothetical protein
MSEETPIVKLRNGEHPVEGDVIASEPSGSQEVDEKGEGPKERIRDPPLSGCPL